MTGTVEVHNLEIRCVVGIREWERRTPQQIALDFAVELPIERAAKSGRVEDSVDYSEACAMLTDFIVRGEFKLLETLVHDSIGFLKKHYPMAQRISMSVRKPSALADAAYAGVTAEARFAPEGRATRDATPRPSGARSEASQSAGSQSTGSQSGEAIGEVT